MTPAFKLENWALIVRATHPSGRDDQRAVLAELYRRRLWLGDGSSGTDQVAQAIAGAGLIVPSDSLERRVVMAALGYGPAPVPVEARPLLPVIFRADRSGDFKGTVTAVFPTLPGTNGPYDCTCYAHVGQHGTCGRDWYATTRAATEAESADLLRELRGIYERDDDADAVRLTPVKRWTRHHDDARRAALSQSRGA